uniref:Putative glycosyltransferase n=2 Tax=viral metagenome TaxID=1070528 RepID=A0A6M3XLS9_9ZZZZ
MTVFSFIKFNPDWKVVVYYPKIVFYGEIWRGKEQKGNSYIGKDYFDELNKLPNVSIEKVYLALPNTSEVFKSDVFRLYNLYYSGGVWCDFDILFIEPMNNLFLNKKRYSHIDVVLCCHKDNYIGFLMGRRYTKFYKSVMTRIPEKINELFDYTKLLDTVYPRIKSSHRLLKYGREIIANLDMDAVYPIHWQDFYKLTDTSGLICSPYTIGIHWYGGSNLMNRHEKDVPCSCTNFICRKVIEIYGK